MKSLKSDIIGMGLRRVSADMVLVQWKTWSDIDNAGFHILRSLTADGVYDRITPAIIFSKSDFF